MKIVLEETGRFRQGNVLRSDVIWLLLLVLGSLLLRVILVKSGGLLHHDGDEYFNTSGLMYQHMLLGDWQGVVRQPVYAHWGTILFGTIPYFLKPSFLTQAQSAALFFSFPAVINIVLIYAISRRFNAGAKASLIAAVLYALSVTTIYMTRSLHPNDLSLMWFLLGILLALHAQGRLWLVFLIGLVNFLCFFTYYGYWSIAFLGMLFVTFYGRNTHMSWFPRGCIASAGFLMPLMVILLVWYLQGVDYVWQFFGFAGTIDFGSFSEGHLIPFLFLLNADGPLFIVWLVCLVLSLRQLSVPVVGYLLLGILLLYLIWVVGSNLLHLFTVYGRLAKGVVPLLCLLSGVMLSGVDWRWLLCGFVLLLSFSLFRAWQLTRVEPIGYLHEQSRMLKQQLPPDRAVVHYLHCEPETGLCDPRKPGSDCKELLSIYVPENLKLYHYEGFNPRQRALMKTSTIHMKLFDCPAE